MKIILFDLDGTLLPMDQDEFTKAYFAAIVEYFKNYELDAQELVAAIKVGTKAMILNDGKKTNEQIFWEVFAPLCGDIKEQFNNFYETDFERLKSSCKFDPQAKEIIKYFKDKGYKIVLAANPVFPLSAQIKRLKWAGMNPSDFSLITSYENSHYSKPNSLYFKEIADQIKVKPSDCLVVGNDTTEDEAATLVGMEFFLLTNCLINKKRKDLSKYRRGDFEQLINFYEAKE